MTGTEVEGEQDGGGVGIGRLVRLFLLASLFLLLVWYALHLTKKQVYSGRTYEVAPVARVVGGPDWLTPAARLELATTIELELGGVPFPIHDRDRLASLCRRLCDRGVAVRVTGVPHLPAQFELALDIRRPCARFQRGDRYHLVDVAGKLVRLPLKKMASSLPKITWDFCGPPDRFDADVKAGAAVAQEVRDHFLPKLGKWIKLRLLAVDVSNLDYRLLKAYSVAEIRIRLATPDGGRILCEWGHPPGSRMVRIPIHDKVRVARQLLARNPGLQGVEAIDLRYPNSPETWVRRR